MEVAVLNIATKCVCGVFRDYVLPKSTKCNESIPGQLKVGALY